MGKVPANTCMLSCYHIYIDKRLLLYPFLHTGNDVTWMQLHKGNTTPATTQGILLLLDCGLMKLLKPESAGPLFF